MHATSAVTYAVRHTRSPSKCRRLDRQREPVPHRIGGVEVRGSGGTVLFRSPVLRSTDLPVPVHVDVRGLSEITLAVEDAGDGRDCDHGAWGDAVLLLEPTAPS